ncbi:uncharacterized protein LOC119596214 [Penaeus monodon]|uniref:uncharacterized protein LOC119596214 n=1 Tax=Penaeus monodon TaxID=6687 RepID=UPI0018A71C0E|nr:uncharacterized protein LOC119596214 [Penaeus monodon]
MAWGAPGTGFCSLAPPGIACLSHSVKRWVSTGVCHVTTGTKFAWLCDCDLNVFECVFLSDCWSVAWHCMWDADSSFSRVQERVTSQANSFAEWHQDVPRSTGLGAMDLQPENDPQLISYIRHVLMKRPSRGPYVLGIGATSLSPSKRTKKLQEYLKKMAGGVFVEAYAGDGEKETSTLYLERNESWSGLLVEPDPALYASLLGKGRKSFSVNSNLSLSLTNFTSRSIDSVKEGNATLPLYTLVRATGMPEIDFLCLHTGGTELQILQTFPWINMRVRIINVEYSNVPGNVLAVQTFLKDKGFDLTIMQEHSATFVRKDLMDELMGTTQRPHARMTLVKIGKKGKTFFEIKRGT